VSEPLPSRRWQPWQFNVQFCQASCRLVTPAGEEGDDAVESGGDPGGTPARSADVTHNAAADSTAQSDAPRRIPARRCLRAVICKIRRATPRCAPGYFFSRATPKIKATVQV
jgi:hypothetical protein